ncbi:MAG: ATP-dependent DNA helicase RecG [Gammaproteobacteria bacterium]|nr:ATP-dependent DNA helicase RecG [Gammaproteobacteria bacterium]
MPSNLVTTIGGIGPQVAERLKNLGIRTIADLLFHMPRGFQDRSSLTKLRDVTEDEACVVQGAITDVLDAPNNQQGLVVHFEDGTGRGTVRFMRGVSYHRNQFQASSYLRLYGKPAFARTFFHPDYEVFREDPGNPEPEFYPIYPATGKITSKRIAGWIKASLHETAFFPKFTHDSLSLADAVKTIHQPDPATHPVTTQDALRRVVFDEMLAFTLVQQRRHRHENREASPLPALSGRDQQLLDMLGFELTAAQKRVAAEIADDLEKPQAMRRLLQGDVGSGKTIIAALAAIRAADNDMQTAIMAPTELLAEQHYQVLFEWFTPLGIDVVLLTSRMPSPQRRRSREAIKSGRAQVVIGTHALFQDATVFKNLNLAIIDEQHRFGVHQRMQMSSKGENAHQLVLTATPIPRTLALTMFGDLAVSTIDELPPGRTPIKTSTHSNEQRDRVIQAVEQQIRGGRQVYWVCVAIDDNEETNLAASTTTYEQLSEQLVNIGVGHVTGRMKVNEKNGAMNAFREGETRLLVATTVIEVGIDVPNATVMVIENAERLGLAQLHQLRGRVGRGAEQSFCLLLYQTPIGATSKERLETMRRSTDGFELAETDLRMRGMGQMFGSRQSGVDPFRVADLGSFVDRYDELQEVVNQLLRDDPKKADEIIATWTPEGQGYAAS